MENGILWINAITIGAAALAVIYTAGVVWRVEKFLDVSYKFFLAGIIFFLLAEGADLLYKSSGEIIFWIKIFRMIFALCFLFGVLFMRNIIRCIDGEKK